MSDAQDDLKAILDTIGGTPVVRINKLAPAHVNLFVKLEARNPMGSVKDRLALAVIEDAESSGMLRPGQTVIEATSGNTGIGWRWYAPARAIRSWWSWPRTSASNGAG